MSSVSADHPLWYCDGCNQLKTTVPASTGELPGWGVELWFCGDCTGDDE